MGKRPPKSPETPKTPEAGAPEGDNKGGTVRKKRGSGTKPNSAQKMGEAADALQMLAEAGAEPASWTAAYNNAVKLYGADALNPALAAKGVDLAKWLPKAEAAATPTNMVTQNDVTTGSVVPVTSVDGALPAVPDATPTPEQVAALQALGIKGGNAAQAAAADAIAPPQKATAAPPTIKEMIVRLMGKNSYVPPADPGPPVLSQVSIADPFAASSLQPVQLRTGEVKPKPAPQPFRFPPGLEPGFDDGRVQLADVDYGQARSTVADPLSPTQWFARQNADASAQPQQLSGRKEPAPPDDPFADIPLDPNKGLVKLRRNRANIINQAAPYALMGAGLGGAGLGIVGLVRMLSGQSSAPQPQQQGEDPDEAGLMKAKTVGGFR